MAGLARGRRRRAAVHHGVGRRRPRDGGPRLAPAAASRGRCCRSTSRPRSSASSRSPCTAITLLGDRFLVAVDRRHRDPVHEHARAAVDRARRHRRLARARSSASATGSATASARACGASCTARRSSSTCCRSPTRSAPAPTPPSRGCARCWSPPARRSCSCFVMRVLTPPPGPAFRRFRVVDVRRRAAASCSFELVPADRKRARRAHEPGQFVTLRAEVPGGERVLRSYSLSSAARGRRGCASASSASPAGASASTCTPPSRPGDVLELSAPAREVRRRSCHLARSVRPT